MERRKATILADYNFSSTAAIDDSFQFINCTGTDGVVLAKDVRAGVVQVEHGRVVIALGNSATLDSFSNVTACVNAVMNALIERFGCLKLNIWVMSLLPRPGAEVQETEYLKRQNKALAKNVRALVRRKNYPIKFITAHKWLLKRVKDPKDETIVTEVDTMYFEEGTNQLNHSGLAHLHLLLAAELRLRKIKYEWKGIPLVMKKVSKRKIFPIAGNGKIQKVKGKHQLTRGVGNRLRSAKQAWSTPESNSMEDSVETSDISINGDKKTETEDTGSEPILVPL